MSGTEGTRPWWETAREELAQRSGAAQEKELRIWMDTLDGRVSGPSDELLDFDPDPIAVDWKLRRNEEAAFGIARRLCHPERNFAIDVTRLARHLEVDTLMMLEVPREGLPSAFVPAHGLGFDLPLDIVWTEPTEEGDPEIAACAERIAERIDVGRHVVVWSPDVPFIEALVARILASETGNLDSTTSGVRAG